MGRQSSVFAGVSSINTASFVVRAGMQRLGRIENEARVSAAVLAEVLAVDVNIRDARRTLEHQVKRLALGGGVHRHLSAVPTFGEGVIGGPGLEDVRDGHGRPGRLPEAIRADFGQRRVRPGPDEFPAGAVQRFCHPALGGLGARGGRGETGEYGGQDEAARG